MILQKGNCVKISR